MAKLDFKVGHGYISQIRLAKAEVIQRIFVTVRDHAWREISPTEFSAVPDSSIRGRTNLWARHRGDGIDFEWHGHLQVRHEPPGATLEFAFKGSAHRDMQICRLGLVVLHPVAPLIGSKMVVDGPEGRESVVISESIHPQPVENGIPQGMTRPFSSLSLPMAGLGLVGFEFSGDLFEFEDQRNWGDASFKTYCTPLKLGFPRSVSAGAVVAQSLKITFRTSGETNSPVLQPGPKPGKVAPGVPRIGRVAPAGFETMSDAKWAKGWAHVRVDLQATAPAAVDRLLGLLPPRTALELVVPIDERQGIASPYLELVANNHPRISALLVRSANLPLPSPNAIARLREQMRATPAAGLPLLASPNGYFVEFNRGKPYSAEVDGVAFPLSPTVHSHDVEMVTANIPAITDMVNTARKLTGRRIVSLSPIALFHPPSPGQLRIPAPAAVAWYSGIMALATSATVSSVTISEDLVSERIH